MARSRRGRGEGAIFQRADGLWVCSLSLGYDSSGKRRRRVVYGNTKKQVQEKMQELQNAPDQPNELKKLRMDTYLAKWLELVKPTIEYQTYRKYAEHVRNHITPAIGMMKLVELKRFHVEELYSTLAANGVSAAHQGKIGTTLTVALGSAQDREMIAVNPTARVKKPKALRAEICPLNADQVAIFLKHASTDRLYPLYAALLDTGARPSELFALEWPDVDFERSSVVITKSLAIDGSGKLAVKDVKTRKARRTITLASSTVEILAEHRKRMMTAGFAGRPVFPSRNGRFLRLTNVHKRSFKPILERAGLPNIRLYDLRHTCATLLLQDGENIKVVSERLGHSNVTMTLSVYCHVMAGMQEGAAERMEGILNRKKVSG